MSIPIKTLTLPISSGGSTTETEYSFITPEDMDEKANVDGYYENLVSGGTEQLLSSVYEEDSEPYLFRTSGGSIDIGDREEDTIVGGTIAWNQLAKNDANAYYGSSGVMTVTYDTATRTITGVSTSTNGRIVVRDAPNEQNHVYYLTGIANASVNDTLKVELSRGWVYKNTAVVASTNTRFDALLKPTSASDSQNRVQMSLKDNADYTLTIKDFNLIDLTQMFGSAIADYIYALEQATAGAGVAWFKKLFPKPYYAYTAGELMNVEGLQSHDMVGFNALSETTNGSVSTQYTLALYGKGKLLPRTTYCLSFVGASGHFLYPNENLFTSSTRFTLTGSRQYIVLTTRDKVSESTSAMYDSTYGWKLLKNGTGNTVTPNFSDVCLNLHWDGERDGEYEPYVKHSYPLDDSLTLRGIPKLDANNKLYYDGDEYESDGTVTRRYGVFDVVTGSDNGVTNDQQLVALSPTGKKPGLDNFHSNNFVIGIASNTYTMAGRSGTATVEIRIPLSALNVSSSDTSQVRLQAAKDWLAAHPTQIVYELATPTTEEAEPYQTPQIVDDFGTEEYVTDSIVPVGHVTKYMPNLKAKLEMAPDSPNENGDFVVRHTNGQNEYVPLVIPSELPTAPSEDGTYHLKVTVTNGTAVLSWEGE